MTAQYRQKRQERLIILQSNVPQFSQQQIYPPHIQRVTLLARTGLLTDRLLIPHGIYVDSSSYVGAGTSNDLRAIAAAGASIVHCPLTSIRYGSALESFARYTDVVRNEDGVWRFARRTTRFAAAGQDR